jgi:hypothetical protein
MRILVWALFKGRQCRFNRAHRHSGAEMKAPVLKYFFMLQRPNKPQKIICCSPLPHQNNASFLALNAFFLNTEYGICWHGPCKINHEYIKRVSNKKIQQKMLCSCFAASHWGRL